MIEIKKLNKSYRIGQNALHVLKGIDMKINEGELVAIWDLLVLVNPRC